jgi:LuxR family maltose regulon positive regulatory protein
LEQANLFLVPLDDERLWYRYHHLFADLLRTQLQTSLGEEGAGRLHLRASRWYEENGLTLEAIRHASLVSDIERIERLIEQNYIQMMNRGEMSRIQFWMGELNRDTVYRRPWLCLYEAFSRSWFGHLEEAISLLDAAEKQIRSLEPEPDTQAMLAYHTYVKSRVTAMQGNNRRAIDLCLTARANIPADNLGLQIEVGITLGYEYFLYGDFANAAKTLDETMQSSYLAGAINNPVAAYALLARMEVYQGRLHDGSRLLQRAAQFIEESGGQYLGAIGLVDAGAAALLYEWNDLDAALARVKEGLDYLPWWGKADDLALAYTTLSRIQLARGNRIEAEDAIEKARQLIRTCGVFSEARSTVEEAQVKLWLDQGNWSAIDRWQAELERRFDSPDPFRYEDELAHITRVRVLMAQNKPDEALGLLLCLEEACRSDVRMGRLVEILALKALALQAIGDATQAQVALTDGLMLAEPSGYVRLFLDEGPRMQALLVQWLARRSASPLHDYASHLLSQFDAGWPGTITVPRKVSAVHGLVEPLSRRELEVLDHIALGQTNQEIARQLVVAPGTIKAHTASIYRKLDVANRTEAVARARHLGILP